MKRAFSKQTCFILADGSLSTSDGLKKDFLLWSGDVGGVLPLEKLEVEVAELLEHRDSILLELSNNNVLGAS